MAITTSFNTGFEYGLVSILGGGLFDTTASGTIVGAAARNGSFGGRCVPTASTAQFFRKLATSTNKRVMRFAVRVGTFPASGSVIICEMGTASQARILISSTGQYSAQVGAGTVQTGPTFNDANWHYVEVQYDTSGATATLDWMVDGSAQTQATLVIAATSASVVIVGSTSTTGPAASFDVDDWIVGQYTGASPSATEWYGDGKGLAQFPGSDGTHVTVADFSFGDAGAALTGTITNANAQLAAAPWSITRSTTVNLAMRVANTGAYLETKPATTAETGSANVVSAILSYSAPTTLSDAAACDVRNSAGAVTALNGTTGGVLAPFGVTSNNFKRGIVTTPAAGWTATEVNSVLWRFGGGTSSDISPVPTVQGLMLEVDWPIVAASTQIPVWRARMPVVRQAGIGAARFS